jgi:hypothetical protein
MYRISKNPSGNDQKLLQTVSGHTSQNLGFLGCSSQISPTAMPRDLFGHLQIDNHEKNRKER